mgnify:CR=1 FL=1
MIKSLRHSKHVFEFSDGPAFTPTIFMCWRGESGDKYIGFSLL